MGELVLTEEGEPSGHASRAASGNGAGPLPGLPGRIGERIPRVEDAALLAGTAAFVDDVPAPGALHLCFVRSQQAHARIR
ncbi:MAG: aerobic carbon-monoxide dehydrogenase large subunit, partial [Solirubrobacteraceae bacterium]|nr:aerobic carbon-monoxide dehydrogenase large subunit [Solirubrobacteraceae bacterium]